MRVREGCVMVMLKVGVKVTAIVMEMVMVLECTRIGRWMHGPKINDASPDLRPHHRHCTHTLAHSH